jgi:hypothetical protein
MKTEGNENDSILLCRKASLSPIKELDELEGLERHTSLDRDSGSSCAEVAKTVADPTFPGLVVSDDDRKSWGLSQRSHAPDAAPIWTPSSPPLPALPTSERHVDIPLTLEREEVTHSSPQDCASQESQDVCRAVPAHHERLNPFSTAGPAGVMSSWTSPNTFLPPVHTPSISSALDCQDVQRSSPSVLLLDAQPSRTTQLDSLPLSIPSHLEDCGRPTAVLGSKGIDSEAGTSSSRTALGSLPSRLHTSADRGTSMRARRRQREPVPQSSNVTSARSDLAPEAFLSSSDDSLITTSRSSGLPLSQIYNLPDVPLARKDAKTRAVKSILKSMPRPPPSRLVPESLDQVFTQSDEASLDEDDPPCASGKARKGCRPNDYRISPRPRDTSSPDCFPPGDSGERVRL